jgi:hypothetical protein
MSAGARVGAAMKLITLGAAASIATLLGGCCTTQGGGSGAFVGKACDNAQATGSSALVTAHVTDTIFDTNPPGQPLALKPNYDKVTGACIDSSNGYINIYGNNAGSVVFKIDFNYSAPNSLAGKAAWPTSVYDAIQVGPPGGGPIPPGPWGPTTWPGGWSPPNFLSGGKVLEFTVPYEAGVQRQYQFQYIVPGQPGNVLHPVEPMIVNH